MPAPFKIYLAAPLFSLNERTANRRLIKAVEELLPQVSFILPQDIKVHSRFNDKRFFKLTYDACVKGIDVAQAVVAICDGCDSDPGTAWEMGYARAKGKPVIGVRTDFRANQELGMNLMLSRGCDRVIFRPSFDENFSALAKDVARALRFTLKLDKTSAK